MTDHRLPRTARGFTLIELLIVLSIIALMLTLSLPRYLHSVDTAKEVLLRDTLRMTRTAIQQFYGDVGRYPESLEELVARRYLSSLPMDPITESSTTWQIAPPGAEYKGRVFDLKSGAAGTTRDGRGFGEL